MRGNSPPLVTLTRSAWRDLTAQAAGHVREGGGLLVARWTRRHNVIIAKVTGMTHAQANGDHILYSRDEIAQARLAAFEVYKPLEPVGCWHSHPWPACTKEALEPQISDDWNDPRSDVAEMLDGDIDIIVALFPWPGYWPRRAMYAIQTRLGGVICRAEAWLRVRRGKVPPCRITVRGKA